MSFTRKKRTWKQTNIFWNNFLKSYHTEHNIFRLGYDTSAQISSDDYCIIASKKKKQYRNIAICGISPEMMEHVVESTNETLIGKLYNLKGVERVDTHTRTPSLGKWNIAVSASQYLTLCTRIDTILQEFYAAFPTEIKKQETLSIFQNLEGYTNL